MVDILNGEGPFTVFAPNNNAFAGIPLDELKPDQVKELKETLLRHVVPGTYKSENIKEEATTIETQGNDTITVTKGNKIKITSEVGGATVIDEDLMASNGVIHVVDKIF